MPVTDCADDGLLDTKDGMSGELMSFNSSNDCVDLFAGCAGAHNDHHGGMVSFL